jgi:peptidylprolyl isomerase
MRPRYVTAFALAATILTVAVGCGEDGITTSAAPSGAPSETATDDTTAFGGEEEETESETAERGSKPKVEIPDGDPPEQLEADDLREGAGPAAKDGDRVSVDYVGVAYSTGEEFDASFDRPEPIEFALGSGEVIPGWDQGIVGMKVGGRRELTIPPDLAYGDQGFPPTIGPNETLVFVVDLLAID